MARVPGFRNPKSFSKLAFQDEHFKQVMVEGGERGLRTMLAGEILSIGGDITNDPNFLVTLHNSNRMAKFVDKWRQLVGREMGKATVVEQERHPGKGVERANIIFRKRMKRYHAAMVAELKPIIAAVEREYRIEKNKLHEKKFVL